MKRAYMFLSVMVTMLVASLHVQAVTVYFKNTQNWTAVKAYIYKVTDGSTSEYKKWNDAESMTRVGGLYKTEVPAGYENGQIIFHNGNGSQYPASGSEGLVIGNKTMCCNGDNWSEFSEASFTVYYDNSVSKWNDVYVYYHGGLEEPEWIDAPKMTLAGGSIYKYEIPAGSDLVIFKSADGQQTGDFDAKANHIYNKNEDLGEYDGESGGDNPVLPVTVPEKLYIMGDVNGNAWNTMSPIALTKNGNKFTAADLNFANAEEAQAYFSFVTTAGASWDVVNSNDRYGAAEEGETVIAGTPASLICYKKNVNASSAKSWTVANGRYNVVVDFDANTVTLNRVEAGTGTLSASDVTIEANGEATLEISLTNSKTIAGLQFDVEFPGNVTSGTPTLLRTTSPTMRAEIEKQSNGAYRYVVYDGASTDGFSGNEGVIMQIPLKANAAAVAGDYNLVFTNVSYSTPTGELVKPGDFTGKMTVKQGEISSYLELNYKIISLKIGGVKTLVGTVMPGEVAAEGIIWTSDNTEVATVSESGVVTAIANGKATITATVGTMEASCDVYVGKETQTITWGETPAKIVIGEEYTLNATATSGLDVTYTITSGATLARIIEGKLVAEKAGVVTVEATQAGNDTYAPANPESVTFTLWLGYDMGDVTLDDEINISDVTMVVDHILNRSNLEGVALQLADMNSNDEIEIADVVLIVNTILSRPVEANNARAKRSAVAAVEEFSMSISGNILSINFSNMQNYVATEFVLTLPANVEATKAQVVGSDHFAAYNNLGDGYARVVVYSLNNEYFNNAGSIYVTLSTAEVENAMLSEALVGTPGQSFAARGISLYNGTTGIATLIDAFEAGESVEVYNLSGVCVYNGVVANFNTANYKGVYVVKNASRVVKVVL